MKAIATAALGAALVITAAAGCGPAAHTAKTDAGVTPADRADQPVPGRPAHGDGQ